MLDLGLRQAKLALLKETLEGSYRARTSLQVLDRNEEEVDTVDELVITGSVDVDSKTQPDRMLQVEFTNLDRRFHFAPGGAEDSSLFADNYLRAIRHVLVPGVGWVDIPLFTGPITAVDRDSETVSVTASGKESLLLEPMPAWQPAHYPRGMRVTDCIRAILRQQGERKLHVPTLKARLRKPVSIGRHTEPWKVVRRLATSLDRDIFYDARGRVRLRRPGAHAVWTFRTGEEGNVTTVPKRSFDLAETRNTVEVLGPEAEGPKKRLRYVATPPAGNPMSPQSLGRNGQPRFIVETIELDHAEGLHVLRERGDRELDDLLRSAVTLDFEALPVPYLEPGDMVALREDGERESFRLRKFTLPLAGEAMVVGDNRRPRVRGRA